MYLLARLLPYVLIEGWGYLPKEFHAYTAKRVKKHQCTMLYTMQQNGVARHKNMSLMVMAQCMVKIQELPHVFELKVAVCAAYVLRRCPTKALQTLTPFEAWNGTFNCLNYAPSNITPSLMKWY